MMRACVASLCVIAACGPSDDQTQGLVAIEVQPANATVTYDSGATMPVDYAAIGHYKDGRTQTLTDVVWSLDTAAMALGALNIAEFRASGAAAGTGTVSAALGPATGATGVSVIVHQ